MTMAGWTASSDLSYAFYFNIIYSWTFITKPMSNMKSDITIY